jgi:hypothetical protein
VTGPLARARLDAQNAMRDFLRLAEGVRVDRVAEKVTR